MKRRSFLKKTGAAGLVTLTTPSGILHAFGQSAETSSLLNSFKNPPAIARPFTWWHWMNGNITKEGITLDLEAMKQVGIGGVQCFNVGSRIPKGPADFLGTEWVELTKHAISESGRLGIEFDLHNCPGWSSTGGPWITPEMSMQQVVWSETLAAGGKIIKRELPKPFVKLEYYRDTFVVAFPALEGENQNLQEQMPKVSSNRGDVNISLLTSADFSTGVEIHPISSSQPGYLQFEYFSPVEARSLTVFCEPLSDGISSNSLLKLEASDDGVSFRKISDVRRAGKNVEMPATASFPNVKARFYRLVVPLSLRIAGFRLSGAARLLNWPSKANFPGAGSAGTLTNAALALQPFIDLDVPRESLIDPDSVIDLTSFMDQEGQLNWKAPAGKWAILRMGHTAIGRKNNAPPDSGSGLECDKFSRVAYDFHFNKMFENLLPSVREIAKKIKFGLLVDSYEVGMQNWTAEMPKEFKQRRGYDLVRYLPALTGRIVGSEEMTERFLWDVRKTHADLMADNYHGYVSELCRKHGMLAYTEPYNNGPFQQMEVGSRMDINMGEFWIRNPHFFPSVKLASSIAHVYGKRMGNRQIVGAESFTGEAVHSKWQEHPYSMKAQGDLMFTRGVNRYIFHRYAHQPHPSVRPGMTMGPWGIHFDRTNTWFEKGKDWLQYISRCQSLLQQGNFVADLLYFVGEDVPGDDLSLKYEPDPAPPKGYDFDWIDAKALHNRLEISDGRMVLPDGTSYRVLLLPKKSTMSVDVLRKLRSLVAKGLVLVGSPPIRTPGLFNRLENDTELAGLVKEMWGDSKEAKIDRRVELGRVIQGIPLENILESLDLEPDFKFSSKSGKAIINYIHRRIDGTEIYYVANRMRATENVVLDFRITGRQPELWHPDTGEISRVPIFESSGNRIRVALNFDPCGSYFVVFRLASSLGSIKRIEKEGRVILGTTPHMVPAPGRYPSITNNFTISIWVKPEVEENFSGPYLYDRGISSNVFYPPQGELLYGKDHTTCGLVAARNGIAVYERGIGYPTNLQSVSTPLSGWTHLALSYDEGIPFLYINGKLIKKGISSGKIVHPGIGEEQEDEFSWFFEGEKSEPELFPGVLTEKEIQQLCNKGVPRAQVSLPVQQANDKKGGLLFWDNGKFTVLLSSGEAETVLVQGAGAFTDLSSNWEVAFPPKLGAPEKIVLPKLTSFHLHSERGVRYFSGTASYTKNFNINSRVTGEGSRIFLDLGQVSVMADVTLNGKYLGLLWKPPYRMDITDTLKMGKNKLEVQVTNLWPNRLIGDEQLPEENEYVNAGSRGSAIKTLPEWYKAGRPKPLGGRVAFSVWKHFDASSPLLESGLIGPVVLRITEHKIFG